MNGAGWCTLIYREFRYNVLVRYKTYNIRTHAADEPFKWLRLKCAWPALRTNLDGSPPYCMSVIVYNKKLFFL